MVMELEFLWLDHGHEEVGEEAQGDQSNDEVFHDDAWLELLAEAHVKRADDEEGSSDAEVEVVHGLLHFVRCQDARSSDPAQLRATLVTLRKR
jgi:hypothetical protein